MRPPRPGSLGDKAIKGAIGATAGMASGSMLTAMGATGVGSAITGASATAVTTFATAVSSVPVVGTTVAAGVTSVASGAAVAGALLGAAAPYLLIGGLVYMGIKKIVK